MDKNQQELYEYARKRVKQKKLVYRHFILFLIVSPFLFVINKWFNVQEVYNWYLWVITAWLFLFILHFVKVFVTESFINKKWEHEQIEKLVARQERRIDQLEKKANKPSDNLDNSTENNNTTL